MKQKEVQEDLEAQESNPVKLVIREDICYLRDEELDYTIPLTFSTREMSMLKTLCNEINLLINKRTNNNNVEYVKWLISKLEDNQYTKEEVKKLLLSIIGEIIKNNVA